MTLLAYPVPNKQRSVDICNAFIKGAPKDAQGDVFFGVNHGNVAPYLRAKALGRTFWYIDNSYLDAVRNVYFRVTKNALQRRGDEPSTGERFASLKIPVKPWREHLGADLLLCEQNQNFMAVAVGYKGDWLRKTTLLLEDMELPFRVRPRHWNSDKHTVYLNLLEDINENDIRMVITHSSGSALTALLEGVPAISQAGAARLYTGPLTRENILNWQRPENRMALFNSLADGQFTLDEMRSGYAWKVLNP